jgi:hypothetical protein
MGTICVGGANTGGNHPGGVKQIWFRLGTLIAETVANTALEALRNPDGSTSPDRSNNTVWAMGQFPVRFTGNRSG